MFLHVAKYGKSCMRGQIKARRYLNIAVAMSGGIDSAMCAVLLQRQVKGLRSYLKLTRTSGAQCFWDIYEELGRGR
jgi:NH3-dependent NAD+ synthetase